MNRSLYLAVRGGQRKKINRLKKYGKKALRYAKTGAKVAGGAAATLALCTATGTCPELSRRTGSGEMYSRLQTKVDDAIKRKLNEYGQEVGKGFIAGVDIDQVTEKAEVVAQKNFDQIRSLVKESGKELEDIIEKADNTKIASLAGYIAGHKDNEVSENDVNQTRRDLNNSSSTIGWLLGF